jgi:fatty-acyl-CoA synthase
MAVHRSGGTVVVLRRFEPELALEAIDHHRVTHSQWVPTMFVRMLKLSADVRSAYDLSTHRHAVHAAAPCPVEVKRAMIEWWGPVLFEYYSMTEALGATSITSEEWLRKPGSVGRPLMGTPHILDDAGKEVPRGEDGTIWFSGGTRFTYHGDPGKTAASVDGAGRATVGDLGHLDEEGYLFLADRRDHLIISGGVNIYPQEVEDALILHPAVMDVAVVGLPDPEMGERVVAVVETTADVVGDQALADALIAHMRSRLAGFKVPRQIRFTAELPRTPTGKLRKHILRAELADGPAH